MVKDEGFAEGRALGAVALHSCMVEAEGSFGKDYLACWLNGKEVAHFEGEHAIDLRLTRKVISQKRSALRADPRVVLRRSSADWITVRFDSRKDIEFVMELAKEVVEAHRPPTGASLKPPPTGADLARRRRFH